MLQATLTEAGHAALLGAATAWSVVLGAQFSFFASSYRELKRDEASHREAIPAYVRHYVSIDWRQVPRVFGAAAALGGAVWFLGYLLVVGAQEVFL